MRAELQALHDLSFLVAIPTVRIYVDLARKHTAGIKGVYYPSDRDIWVSPLLRGSALYRVVLHEIGHHLGLGHALVGVMAARSILPEDLDTRRPAKAKRQQWCLEVAQQVVAARARRACGGGRHDKGP